jgi:hypothetical protein
MEIHLTISESGGNMTSRRIALTLALCISIARCFAQDVQMGIWKLNEAKSKIGAGAPKNTKIVFEAVGDTVRVTIDGIGGDGKPTHNVWTGRFDGKDYAVTGDPTSDKRSYLEIDDHTLGLNARKGSKIIISGRITVSPDGKTRTVTVSGADPTGKKFQSIAVYDRH